MALEVINCGYDAKGTGEEYLKNKIIRMYKDEDEDAEAVLYIQPKIRDRRPDFILIDKDRGICILEVKDWDKNFIGSLNVLNVINFSGKVLTNPAHQARTYFNLIKSTLELSPKLCNSYGELKIGLNSFFIMTNMTNSEILQLESFYKHNIISCLGSDDLRKMKLSDLFINNSVRLEDYEMKYIRSVINPEIKIVDTPDRIKKNEKLEDLIKVLDYKQERFAKRIIDGHYIVTGIPGSGKTIMLLSRAMFISKEHPEWKITVLCYNKSLASKLKKKIGSLAHELEFSGANVRNIKIIHFHGLLKELYPIDIDKRDKDFFFETWPRTAMQHITPLYDAILIDEYQDFSDTAIQFCLKCCKKHNEKENLFLAGDRLQSIYNPKETSWKSLGINIVGRSSLLKTSYRAGKKHIITALEFLKNDPKLKEEVNRFYEGDSDIITNDYGDEISFLTGEYNLIINEINKIVKSGYKYKDILILCPTNPKKNEIYNLLPCEMQINCSTEKDELSNEKMTITTYHSSKGLENKICILVDFDTIKDRKLAYVGMTRAAELLYIHATDYDSTNFASEIRDIVE